MRDAVFWVLLRWEETEILEGLRNRPADATSDPGRIYIGRVVADVVELVFGCCTMIQDGSATC